MPKLNVALIFGGQSAEHEVSLQSALNVYQAIDRTKYNPLLIAVTKQGQWLLPPSQFLINSSDPKTIQLNPARSKSVALTPATHGNLITQDGNDLGKIDVVFPILHGPLGEDGTIQGLLRLTHLPFVGSDVLGSAVSMDKDIAKRLLRDAKLPIPNFIAATKSSLPTYDQLVAQLGSPFFVKPANLGSSVGVSKVKNNKEFTCATRQAFTYDTKILIEENIPGREIECAILGNDNPIASVPGEVIPTHEFYSYEAKYTDPNGANTRIPADISPKLTRQIQSLAIQTFLALECSGLARVDFFLTPDNQIYINEINTIPGFTNISMYPKLWEASGISYTELISRLIELALEKHHQRQSLSTVK